MSDINRVVITGRLTRDPEVRTTAGGSTVMGLGIANNERRRNQQSGQWEDYTNFFDCTMFGSRAESLSHILTKGTLVCIEGRLRWSSWERDGQKRSKVEIIVDEIVLPSRSSQNAQGGGDAGMVQQSYGAPQQSYGASQGYVAAGSYSAQPAPSYGAPMAQPPMDQVYDEEIPF